MKSQTVPAFFIGVFPAVEFARQKRQFVLRHAAAKILYDYHKVRPLESRAHLNIRAGVFIGIADDVVKHLLQTHKIG